MTVLPSAASDRMKVRIQMMPSGANPVTGSSNIRICGSPRSAAAMPRRWLIPRENPLLRFPATSDRPTTARTSSTRRRGMSLVWARLSRWLRAVRRGVRHSADRDGPAGRVVKAEDHPHGGGLAGAVRAEEPGHDTGPDSETEIGNGSRAAVAFRETARLDHRISLVSVIRSVHHARETARTPAAD